MYSVFNTLEYYLDKYNILQMYSGPCFFKSNFNVSGISCGQKSYISQYMPKMHDIGISNTDRRFSFLPQNMLFMRFSTT